MKDNRRIFPKAGSALILAICISAIPLNAEDKTVETYEWTGELHSKIRLDLYQERFQTDFHAGTEKLFSQKLSPNYGSTVIGWANESLEESDQGWGEEDLLQPLVDSLRSAAKGILATSITNAEVTRRSSVRTREFEAVAIATPANDGSEKVKLAEPEMLSTEGNPTYALSYALGTMQLPETIFALTETLLPDGSKKKEIKSVEAFAINVTGTRTEKFTATGKAKYDSVGSSGVTSKSGINKDASADVYSNVQVTFVYSLKVEAETPIGQLSATLEDFTVTVPIGSDHPAMVSISEQ